MPQQVIQPAAEASEVPVHGASIVYTPNVAGPAIDVAETGSARNTPALLGHGVSVVPPSAEFGPDNVGGRPGGRGAAALALAHSGTSVLGPPADFGPDSAGRKDGHGSATASQGAIGAPHGTSGVTGLVISATPGNNVGAPEGGGAGSIAMSPAGSGTTGLGGSGTGHSIGRGSGTGSGTKGVGPGAATTGTGHGADPYANGGISPSAGPGGSGSGDPGFMSSITVSGGGTVYDIPSFSGTADPNVGSIRSQVLGPRQIPGVTIVASGRSGSTLNQYGVLKGSRVYTIYIETVLGTAVMEYSERDSPTESFQSDLTSPEPLRAELPEGLKKERVLIACIIDRSGTLRNLHLLAPHGTATEQQLLAALQRWRFRPVLRGDASIEADAIIGFDIDTR